MDYTQLVIDALAETQRACGSPETPIHPETTPLQDLPEFDSLRSVEFISVLEEKLGRALDGDNFTSSEHGNRGLTVAEIAKLVEAACNGVQSR